MKINRAFPIEKIIQALDYYWEKSNRRVTLEYILLKDINDHREHALELAERIGDRRHLANVNLIQWTSTVNIKEANKNRYEHFMTR
jgi:23S rRNA (adenine2503-C2)-methyltransferase